MNGSIPVLLVERKCALRIVLWRWYSLRRWRMALYGVILHHAVPPRQTVNSAYYCKFLQHHLRPALTRKRRHFVLQNPMILHKNARSHPAAAVTARLAPLAVGDSGTPTLLTRYESMRLRSLRQSERTSARDPVQHERWTYPYSRTEWNINKYGRADGDFFFWWHKFLCNKHRSQSFHK